MDSFTVAEGLVQQLLRQTDGSAPQREHTAAQLRQVVMAAPMLTGAEGPVATVATVHPSGGPVPRIAAQLPKFSGFSDLQSPEEFLERLENFCLVAGVAADKRLEPGRASRTGGQCEIVVALRGRLRQLG